MTKHPAESAKLLPKRSTSAPALPSSRHEGRSKPSPSLRNRAPSESQAGAAIPELVVSAVDAAFEKFRLGDELGRGSIGVVHVALDRDIGREVAIKRPRDPKDAESIAKFIEEAQITGQLEHPNIVPVHELGLDTEGRPWLAMKRLSGETLLAKIERWKRKTRRGIRPEHLGNTLDIFKKICDAIAYAHAHGVIHRDLKPENVMLGEFGEVMVVDWGLAKPLFAHEPPASRTAGARVVTTARQFAHSGKATVAGMICGTPAYMPPEQARGHAVTERSDIFALGAVLYHLLTFEPPYSGRTTEAVLLKAAQHQMLSPRVRSPNRRIPRELDAIVMRAMAAEPGHRYPTAAALKADIHAFQANLPISAVQYSPLGHAAKWVLRHPSLAVALGFSAAFVALLMGLTNTMISHDAELQRHIDATKHMQADYERRLDALQSADRPPSPNAALRAD